MTFKRISVLLLFLGLMVRPAWADDYRLGPDSQYQPGVPRGEVTHYTWTSRIFPGTQRDYWVYVPKQYDAATPACVMIFQDGGGFQDVNGQFRVPVVFDNLIHQKQMPVTIAIMINPGVVPASGPDRLPRYNRSYEYDAPTGDYARFLLEEILPEVGKRYKLTQDPNGRALCGASSGGICAFTAAWERPDQFRRVISYVGSFTNLRGGHAYPSLIRKFEPAPLRVFLQDGANDQDIYSGSWYIGNQDVAAALRFGRYDMQFVVGTGGHDGRQGGAILPDALRWLWRDYPAPLQTPTRTPQPIMEVVQPGEEWHKVTDTAGPIGGLAADGTGRVFFTDPASGRISSATDGEAVSLFRSNDSAVALAIGPNGRLYGGLPGRRRIVAWDMNTPGRATVVASGVPSDALVVDAQGGIYAADTRLGEVRHLLPGTQRRPPEARVPGALGLTLTPDQSLLLVTAAAPDPYAHSLQVQPDGALTQEQPYFDLHIPAGQGRTGATGMVTDTDGRLYVASLTGVQVCDQAGRVIGILRNPGGQPTTWLAFGGANHDMLYAAAGNRLYRRRLRTHGALPFQAPTRPAPPRL